jgi:hypothetical protein
MFWIFGVLVPAVGCGADKYACRGRLIRQVLLTPVYVNRGTLEN